MPKQPRGNLYWTASITTPKDRKLVAWLMEHGVLVPSEEQEGAYALPHVYMHAGNHQLNHAALKSALRGRDKKMTRILFLLSQMRRSPPTASPGEPGPPAAPGAAGDAALLQQMATMAARVDALTKEVKTLRRSATESQAAPPRGVKRALEAPSTSEQLLDALDALRAMPTETAKERAGKLFSDALVQELATPAAAIVGTTGPSYLRWDFEFDVPRSVAEVDRAIARQVKVMQATINTLRFAVAWIKCGNLTLVRPGVFAAAAILKPQTAAAGQ